MRPVVQSYKKVLNEAPLSTAAGGSTFVIVKGEDSVAAGQTTPTDPNVPTGCLVKFIDIAISWSQIVGGSVFMNYSIQHLHTGQAAISSLIVGGSPQRNQVFHQFMTSVGINQNFNRTIRFKIPAKFQRIRDGDKWVLRVENSNTIVAAYQFIYKFYR